MLIFVFVKQSVNTMSVNKNNYVLFWPAAKDAACGLAAAKTVLSSSWISFRQDARFFSRLTTAWPDLFLLKIFISVQTTSITTW